MAPGCLENSITVSCDEVRDLAHQLSNDVTGAYGLLELLLTSGALPDRLIPLAEQSFAGLQNARGRLAVLSTHEALATYHTAPAESPASAR